MAEALTCKRSLSSSSSSSSEPSPLHKKTKSAISPATSDTHLGLGMSLSPSGFDKTAASATDFDLELQLKSPPGNLEKSLQPVISSISDFKPGILKSMSLDDKLDCLILQMANLTTHCQGNTTKFRTIVRKVKQNTSQIQELKSSVQGKIRYLESRNGRLEDRLLKLEKRLEETEYNSNKNNVIIYNLPESQQENSQKNSGETVAKFLETDMKCNRNKIQIDVAYRMGKPKMGKTRPLLVRMITKDSKDHIMRKVGNLAGSNISVGEQLPPKMQERRLNQLGDFKKLKQEKGKEKVKLVKDKLVCEGLLVNPRFESNPIKPATATFDSEEIEMVESEQAEDKGSIFWGYGGKIKNVEQAQEGLAKIMEDSENAEATHIVYAYRVEEAGEGVISGHSDDGEVGASKILYDLLEDSGDQALIAVLRFYGGTNLGPLRFKMYRNQADDIIKKLRKPLNEPMDARSAESDASLRLSSIAEGNLANGDTAK